MSIFSSPLAVLATFSSFNICFRSLGGYKDALTFPSMIKLIKQTAHRSFEICITTLKPFVVVFFIGSHILLCEMDLGGYLVITLAINNGYIGLSGIQFGLQSYE